MKVFTTSKGQIMCVDATPEIGSKKANVYAEVGPGIGV